jgi:hypothetical protein
MTRQLTLLALLAALPLAAGCGSGGTNTPASAPASARTTTPPRRPAPKPASLVLQLSDVGYGYLAAPSQSKPISLREELQSDGPASKAADRAGYLGGYRTLFADGTQDGILPVALIYKPGPYATTVIGDLTGMHRLVRAWHACACAPLPAAAPGTHRHMYSGLTHEDGVGTVPAYLYFWQHGTVLNELILFGRHTSAERLLALAEKQDQRQTRLGL